MVSGFCRFLRYPERKSYYILGKVKVVTFAQEFFYAGYDEMVLLKMACMALISCSIKNILIWTMTTW
jgi:hypothetical protein